MVIQPGGQSRNMKNSGLNMSRRIRRTPFTNKVEEFGVSGFTVVNHMLLPKAFQKTVEEDYWHLKSNVQIWDVSCQRQVQIEGPDAEMLVQKMTPRFIKNMKIGKCLYVPIIDENAGMLNDPVLLKITENKFWLSIADSDILLWAKALAVALNLNVKIDEPNIYPLAIQGPKAEDLMISVFGNKIRDIKFFNFDFFEFRGTKQLIARAGYSKQGGFEIFFNGYELGGDLWDTIWKAGKKFNITPGCPNLIERIEGGLMSYGNDFTRENNPLECNLDNFCSIENTHEYIGKKALDQIRVNGVKQKIRGILFDGGPCPTCSIPFPIYAENKTLIGQITSGIYSPRFEKNVGLSMILKDYWDIGQQVKVLTPDNKIRNGTISALPFSN